MHMPVYTLFYILNVFIYNVNYINTNIEIKIFSKYILYLWVNIYLYIRNIHRTHTYYANKKVYFGCD